MGWSLLPSIIYRIWLFAIGPRLWQICNLNKRRFSNSPLPLQKKTWAPPFKTEKSYLLSSFMVILRQSKNNKFLESKILFFSIQLDYHQVEDITRYIHTSMIEPKNNNFYFEPVQHLKIRHLYSSKRLNLNVSMFQVLNLLQIYNTCLWWTFVNVYYLCLKC